MIVWRKEIMQYMQITDKTGVITLMGILIIGLMMTGCEKKAPPQKPGPVEVSVVTVQPQRVVLTTELPGRTSPYLIAEVRPQVGGIIQKRLFTEGAIVKTGEVLYQIDPSTYQASYDSARAALARSEANVVPARLKAERYKELIAIKAVSQQEYDEIVAASKQAEADVTANKASVETARINLAYTRVVAPITGRIGRSSVTTGALVTASQAIALATIQQLDPIYVDVTQSSTDLLRMEQAMASGQLKKAGANQTKVKLLLEDGTSYPLTGTLKFSEVTVDQTTGAVTLRTVFPNPKNIVLPGMFVRAVVSEGVKEKAILIPQQAVSRDPKGNPLAYVVGAESKVEQRMLTLDRAIGNQWLVTSGLAAGDRVIVEGMQKIRPGTVVTEVPFTEEQKLGTGTEPVKTNTTTTTKK